MCHLLKLATVVLVMVLATSALACGGTNTRLIIRNANAQLGDLKGDEDDDDVGQREDPTAPFDRDADQDYDTQHNPSKGYYDSDDGRVRTYGQAATPADRQALTSLFERYLASALAENGSAGCALTYSVRANSLWEDYGPTYLPGAKTCAPVLTAMFKRLHSEFARPFEIVAVRVKGERAYILLGSTDMPASLLEAEREHGVWKVDEMVPALLR